jgi:hypothetical protein
MYRCRIVTTATLLIVLTMAAASHAAPVVTVDSGATNTLVFRDYNGTSDANVTYNPAPAPSQAMANGTSTWTYAAALGDPKIIYNDGAGAWDHAAYPWTRFRFVQSRTTGGTAQYWENPARGGEGSSLGTAAALTEVTKDVPNATPDGTGYRIDPFSDTQIGDWFTLDYVLVDTYETLGRGEWDLVGDQQGWNLVNIANNWSVTNSVFSGTCTNGPAYDAQIVLTQSFDGNQFKYIEIRMKYSGSEPDLFWRQNTNSYHGSRRVDFGAGVGQWHTYLIDFTDEPMWANTTFLRLDPTQGAGHTFELDYVRVRKGAYGIGNHFTEAVTTDWNTAGNWSQARVPANGDQPTVTGHTAVVSAAVPGVGETTIGNGGTVQVTAGGSLTVAGDVSVGSGGAGSLTIDGGAFSWSGRLWSLANNGSVTISGTSATVTGTRNDGGAGIEIQNNASLNFVMGATAVSPLTLSGNAKAAIAGSSILTVDGSAYTGGTGTIALVTHNGYAGVGTFGTVTITGFGGITGSVEYAANAVNLVLAYADVVPIANPSFEVDSGVHAWPGYGTITSWAFAGMGGAAGVNPSDAGSPFADNGAMPDRTAVAFIQNDGSISQTLNGLDTNSTYWLQFWYNARNANTPELKVEFAGTTVIDWAAHASVGGATPYNYTNVVFTPASPNGLLTLHSRTPGGDNTTLFDAVCMVRRDAFQHPIMNPSFEASGTPGGAGAIPENIAGWTKVGSGSFGVNDQSLPFYDNGLNPGGNHIAFIKTTPTVAQYLRQELTGLIPGQQYELSYAYNLRAWNTGPTVMTVSIGATTLFNGSITSVAGENDYTVPFSTANHEFTASASTATLSFGTPALAQDRSILLDDVRLTAIPEQGTLFILR